MVASNIQSPQSGFSAAGPGRVQFGGEDGPSSRPHIAEVPDRFERQGRVAAEEAAASPARQDQAFAWIKDLIAEARTNPHASLPELLHASEAKRFGNDIKLRTNALLDDVRQLPGLSGVLSKGDFKDSKAVPDDLDALLSQADQDTKNFSLMLHDLKAGKPLSLPVIGDDHPLGGFLPVPPAEMKALFAKQNAELKARQKAENEARADRLGLEDTPELRKELLAQGAVANEAEIPAFLAKVGVRPAN